MTRTASLSGELARRGFDDASHAAEVVQHLAGGAVGECFSGEDMTWLEQCEWAADPDMALEGLESLTEVTKGHPHAVLSRICAEERPLRRLVAILGGSMALSQHLFSHPEDLDVLIDEPVGWTAEQIVSDVRERVSRASEEHWQQAVSAAMDRLRLANRRHLVRIAARDLTSLEPEAVVDSIAAELAHLADAVMQSAVSIAEIEVEDADRVRFSVIGLGKCGAQELNYISDVDVLFVVEPASDDVSTDRATTIGTRLAAATTRICFSHTRTGTIWQVDPGLRPEGKAGPLVRSLGSMRTYYDKWASNWEFQAMMKARPMAGDQQLGAGFCEMITERVWQAGERDGFISESRAMRKRVIEHLPAREADREIKLSSGGLRDVEFTVQMLQLVHGRADERLRSRDTLSSLQSLIDHGYIGRGDGAELAAAYRFQRVLEHRVQLFRMRRTHLMPDDEPGLRRLARGLGVRSADELTEKWRASAKRVQRLHRRVFYSPLLEAVVQIDTDELRLSPQAARARLRALGFKDPASALRHMESLTQGTTRAVAIQRQLLPVLLGWFAEGPNPDLGLLSFRQLSEALGSSPWYLRAMRDQGLMAPRLAHILASSRYVVDMVKRAPDAVQMLASDDQLLPRQHDELVQSMIKVADRHADPDQAISAVRAYRRRELIRIAIGDLLDLTDLETIGAALSDLAGATVDAALSIAHRGVEDPPRLGVVAMGRWGGREMGYGSDCDAMFVIAEGEDDAALQKATAIVSTLRGLLTKPGPEPTLAIDADLRPEGKGGALVRTLASYQSYYQRWSSTWEAQALVRAAHGAGDAELTGRLLASVAELRWPAKGLSGGQLNDIRKLKLRMETERMPRGSDPSRNTKLGRGGLSDVEWTVQVLQMQRGSQHPEVRSTSTLPALHELTRLGAITPDQADALEASWRFASKLRNAIVLSRGRASDAIPTDARDVAGVAHLLGYPVGCASELVDDWRRDSRHAARVVDTLFWGKP